MAYLERIFETMDEPVDVKDAEDAYEMPDIKGEVEYRDVTFAYEEGKNILENVSFTVKPGESIALVGPTGSSPFSGHRSAGDQSVYRYCNG